MTCHPCLIRRTFLTCFSWVSYQWWSTTVNSMIRERHGEIAVAALSSFYFPDSMPYNVCCVFTYLTVISSSHLPATNTAVFRNTRNRLFFLFGSSRWYSYSSHEIFLWFTFSVACSALFGISFIVSNLSCPVTHVISGSHCLLQITLLTFIKIIIQYISSFITYILSTTDCYITHTTQLLLHTLSQITSC